MSYTTCSSCNEEFNIYSLYWYKSKALCKECYPAIEERITVAEVLDLFNTQNVKTKEMAAMDDNNMSEKQAKFVRFIYMYSSSKQLPYPNYYAIQKFINNYKDEAISLSDKLKRLCDVNENGYPILCVNFSVQAIMDGVNYMRKHVVAHLDEVAYEDIYDDELYDSALDKENLTEY